MISKEKLLNGYVKADDKELVKLFLAECLKYDDINLPLITESTHNKWWYFAISESMTPCGHGISAVEDKKELTLDDFKDEKTKSFLNGADVTVTFTDDNADSHTLQKINTNNKPKTKVTYELVTDKTINEIAKAMIDGEVFCDKYGIDYYKWNGSRFINNKGLTASCDGEFYRKVEKEIDWKDEGLNYVGGCKHLELYSSLRTVFTCSACDKGMEFDSEFLELCRVILRETGELK